MLFRIIYEHIKIIKIQLENIYYTVTVQSHGKSSHKFICGHNSIVIHANITSLTHTILLARPGTRLLNCVPPIFYKLPFY